MLTIWVLSVIGRVASSAALPALSACSQGEVNLLVAVFPYGVEFAQGLLLPFSLTCCPGVSLGESGQGPFVGSGPVAFGLPCRLCFLSSLAGGFSPPLLVVSPPGFGTAAWGLLGG